MSISRQNLTAIIVTFKSDNVIHKCLQSIDKEIKIIVIDNSNDQKFKEDIENQYNNVSCILSKENLGMGAGNNLGIKNVKTDFAFILNPDVILESNTLDEIIDASKKIESFGVIAPVQINKNFPNYNLLDKNHNTYNEIPFRVKSVDGYAMILNLKRLNLLDKFEYFDENFFMYLENEDLCKRLLKQKEKIFVVPKSKIKHLGGKAVDEIYENEIELSRNWHWMWSKFYFNKKHYGYFLAIIKIFHNLISGVIKSFYYLLVFNKRKKKIYQMRLFGLFNSIIGKKSFYRPKIKD